MTGLSCTSSSLSPLFTAGIPITINLNDFLVSTYMHVPCSLGYFECQHVAPNCCCHIRKASITTCLLVAHWQSKLQVSFCARSTTVSKTQSVYKQIYGLGESFAPDAVTSHKAGTSKLWLLPQIGHSRLLHLLSITRQWLCLIDCSILLSPSTKKHQHSLCRFWCIGFCDLVMLSFAIMDWT